MLHKNWALCPAKHGFSLPSWAYPLIFPASLKMIDFGQKICNPALCHYTNWVLICQEKVHGMLYHSSTTLLGKKKLPQKWFFSPPVSVSVCLLIRLSLWTYAAVVLLSTITFPRLCIMSLLSCLPLNCWDGICVLSLSVCQMHGATAQRCAEHPDSRLAPHPARCASEPKAAVTPNLLCSSYQTFIVNSYSC